MWAQEKAHLDAAGCEKRNSHEQLAHCRIPAMRKLLSAIWNSKTFIFICTMTLPVVLYGCETWSLTLREGCRLRVFENKVLRRIFGPTRVTETGKLKRLLNEGIYALHSSPDIIRITKSKRLRWAGYVARMRAITGVYRDLVEKPE